MLTIDDMMNPDFVKIYEDCLKYSRGALYESYGISKDVRKEASELSEYILKCNPANIKFSGYLGGHRKTTLQFDRKIFGLNVEVIVDFYEFTRKEDFYNNKIKGFFRYGLVIPVNDNDYYLKFGFPISETGETFLGDYENLIYHEVHHLLWHSKVGKDIRSFKDEKEYKIGIDKLYSDLATEKEKDVARCIYFCDKSEQCAIISEMDSVYYDIINSGIGEQFNEYTAIKILEETPIFPYLVSMSKITSSADLYIKEIRDITGRPAEAFQKYVSKRYNYFLKAFSRLVRHALDCIYDKRQY